jgi:dephospho-CoA kinase
MIAIGLTGGIGAGKSTVAAMLVGRGAELIDADVLAREVVEPGRPALGKIRERFGKGILRPDGSLDRPALAAIVFGDEQARADLNSIVHPEVGRELRERLARFADSDSVVILDVPLLAEGGRDRYPVAGVLVVDVPEDMATERLVSMRNMTPQEAEARIAAQSSRDDRLAIADFIIMNMGTLAELEEMVSRAWAWMNELRETV